MANVLAKIVNVDLNTTAVSQQGKQYDAYTIVYRNTQTNEVKEWTKPLGALKFNKALAQKLGSLKPNDVVTLVTDKNEKGFLDLLDVLSGEQEAPPPSVSQERPRFGGGGVSRNNINDDARQVMIIKQSSLQRAIELGAKTPAEAIDIAAVFTNWVANDVRPEVTTVSNRKPRKGLIQDPPLEDDEIPFGNASTDDIPDIDM